MVDVLSSEQTDRAPTVQLPSYKKENYNKIKIKDEEMNEPDLIDIVLYSEINPIFNTR